MAKILPTPSRGQPIDAAFLFELTNAVNDLIKAVDQRKGKTYVKATNTQSVVSTKATSNTSFFGSTVKVKLDSENVSTDSKGEADVKFSEIAFDGPPVVTATPVIFGDVTDATKSAIVTISDVTKAGCKVNVRFAAPGTVRNLHVQVIAVGTIS
jgi:hypothetical protein